MYDAPLTVSDLNSYVRTILENDEVMQNVYIVGEVSNFKHHASGHIYFSLKDDKSSLKAVMFAERSKNISFDLKNGMKIFAYGYVSCYEVAGQYQLYVYYVSPAGKGEINEELKRLYDKFSQEGLFDDFHKKEVCKYPRKIGVISSKTGAVIHDISSVLKRRFPIAEIILCSVNVQGEKAASQIVKALKALREYGDIDTIIIARGGGSTEDLWAFNDENLIREIFNCDIPVISAVGHDVDYTLCDYVSDVRAPTPSVAAELSSISVDEIRNLLGGYKSQIKNYLCSYVNELNLNIDLLKNKINVSRIKDKLEDFNFKLKFYKNILNNSLNKKLEKYSSKLEIVKTITKLSSKEYILKKGYVILMKDDTILLDMHSLKNEDMLTILSSEEKIKFKISDLKLEEKIEK